MRPELNWQTEDEDSWENRARVEAARPTKKRRWPRIVAVTLLVALTAYVVTWQIERRTSAVERSTEQDVSASYTLLRTAIKSGDIDLFRSLISGAVPAWTEQQIALFERGWIIDKFAFDLASVSYMIQSIALSPTLNRAEVEVLEEFDVRLPDGNIEKARLKHVEVFRLGSKWLWSPPENSYWGNTIEKEEKDQRIAAEYPARDESVVSDLLVELERYLDILCADTSWGECPQDLRIHIKFDDDPGKLFDLSDSYRKDGLVEFRGTRSRPGAPFQFTLPSPSLIGIPVDDTGRRILLNRYTGIIIGSLLDRFADRSCCETDSSFIAAIRSYLVEFGLMSWQPDEGVELEEARDSGDFLVMCQSGFYNQRLLYHYDHIQSQWRNLEGSENFVTMRSLSHIGGVIIEEREIEGNLVTERLYRWNEGVLTILFEEAYDQNQAEQFAWTIRDYEPSLVVRQAHAETGLSTYLSFNLSACGPEDCTPIEAELQGIPIWSPDQSQFIVDGFRFLWRRDESGTRYLGAGSTPFWIDDTTYGFVRYFDGNQRDLVLGRIRNDRTEVILTVDDLIDAMPDAQRPNQLIIGAAGVPTGNSQYLYILAFGVERREALASSLGSAFVFTVNLDNYDLRYLLGSTSLNSLNITSDGTGLTAGLYAEDEGVWRFDWYEFESSEKVRETRTQNAIEMEAPKADWTDDGQWLAILDRGVIYIHSANSGVVETLIPPLPSCYSAFWLP